MAIQLKPSSSGALYQQLFESLRLAILEGQFSPGQRIPASRELSQQLSMSRNTVITALEMLKAEGYIESRVGSGLFVSSQLPEQSLLKSNSTINTQANKNAASPIALSKRGAILANRSRAIPRIKTTSFVPGLPDLGCFPFKQWAQCVHAAL